MRADSKLHKEIKSIVERWFSAYSNRDLKEAMALVASDPDVAFIGPGRGEKHVGHHAIRAALKKEFLQTDSILISLPWLQVSTAWPVAWVAADCRCQAVIRGQKIKFEARQTFVLESRNERWFIMHSHFSLPAAGPAEEPGTAAADTSAK